MSSRAATWKRVRFGEVVRLNKETCKDPAAAGVERAIGLEHLEPGDLRVRSWGDVGAGGTTFTNRVRPGQVLFGKRRAYQRKVAVADFDAVCSGDIYLFESASPSKLLPDLLPFICQTDSFLQHAVGTSAGSLSPRTNWSSLAEYEFPLPPLNEQQRIASMLTAWAAHLDCLRDVALNGARTLAAFRDEHFKSLPSSDRRLLGGAVLSSAYGPRFAGDSYSPNGNVRSIRTSDMPEFGRLTLHTAPAAIVPPQVAAEHQLHDGDFLISRTGFTSGRVAVFRPRRIDGMGDADMADVVFIPAAFMVRLRLDPQQLEPEYLLEFIQSSKGWAMIRGLQRGTQQLNISASALLARVVPIPDVRTQHEALDTFVQLHGAVSRHQQRLSEASTMMRHMAAHALGARV